MRLYLPITSIVTAILTCSGVANAISLNLNSTDSIKEAAKTVAADLVSWYTGWQPGDIPGNLPDPWHWWQAGAMFGALIDYWHLTNDTTHNDITYQAMLHQVGPKNNYMPPNQTKNSGNDDVCFWALSAMAAAEYNFPDPPPSSPQWLSLAQAVFKDESERWDEENCGGGIKWQIHAWQKGYLYKNAVTNGCAFNLASRLAMYTGDRFYADWAEKVWDWMSSVKIVGEDWSINDGCDTLHNCTRVNHVQFSYNAGLMLLGAANMYSYNNESLIWRKRTQGILNRTLEVFFNDQNIMQEPACDSVAECWMDDYITDSEDNVLSTVSCGSHNTCDNNPENITGFSCEVKMKCNEDMRAFKGFLSRWMAATTQLAPWMYDQVMGVLSSSAMAAAAQCTGEIKEGRGCGQRWVLSPVHDGWFGVAEQMAALEVIQSNLVQLAVKPVTKTTGGTSKGDEKPGFKARKKVEAEVMVPPTYREKVAVGFGTAGFIVVSMGFFVWICM